MTGNHLHLSGMGVRYKLQTDFTDGRQKLSPLLKMTEVIPDLGCFHSPKLHVGKGIRYELQTNVTEKKNI